MSAASGHMLAGAYAVDALDRAEGEQFRRHLHACPACATEVDGLRRAVGELSLLVCSEPPMRLRSSVVRRASVPWWRLWCRPRR